MVDDSRALSLVFPGLANAYATCAVHWLYVRRCLCCNQKLDTKDHRVGTMNFYCGHVIEQGDIAALAIVDEQGRMSFWANQEFNWSQARSCALLAQPFLPEPSSEHWVHPNQLALDLQRFPAGSTFWSGDALQLQLALRALVQLPPHWSFVNVPKAMDIPVPPAGRFKEQALHGWRVSRLENKIGSGIVKA